MKWQRLITLRTLSLPCSGVLSPDLSSPFVHQKYPSGWERVCEKDRESCKVMTERGGENRNWSDRGDKGEINRPCVIPFWKNRRCFILISKIISPQYMVEGNLVDLSTDKYQMAAFVN